MEFRFRGVFPTVVDAMAFVTNLNLLRLLGVEFVKTPLAGTDARTSELLVKTLNGIEARADGEQVRVRVQVSAGAVDALISTVKDLPTSLLKRLFSPAEKP
jgi:hypothetical protein